MDIYDYETYIFDFDGVIVDSELSHYMSYKKALELLNIEFTLTYDNYCELRHSNINNLLKEVFGDRYFDIYKLKTELYKQSIKDIVLKPGFKDFYYNLLKKGKDIFVVTDTTKEICMHFIEKFDFLKTLNYITRDDVTMRKPNSEGYLNVLKKMPNLNVVEKLKKCIVFEDSYSGYLSASNIFYNVILVNSKEYYYFNIINPLNYINNFTEIDKYNVNYKKDIISAPFYISSKTKHMNKWVQLKERTNFNITSQWIYKNTAKNEMSITEKEDLCQSFLDDIKKSDFGIFYSEYDDVEFFGTLIEVGMLTSLNKPVYIMGDNKFKNEIFYHLNKEILNFNYINEFNITKNVYHIYIDNDKTYQELCTKVISLLKNNSIIISPSYVLDYVAIVACGDGTRLFPITNHIPKLLVTIDNVTILDNIITYWKEYTSKFIIVIQQKYNNMAKFYLDLLKIEYEIINVEIIKGYENSFTIHNAFNNSKFKNKKILLTWCDIYPTSFIQKNTFSDMNIIFTYKNFGRYDAINNQIYKKQYGNVIGIYYFSKFNNITKFKETMDICDCYKDNFDDFITYEIESLIDIGDINKLNTLLYSREHNYNTRYFNKITHTSSDTLVKQSVCDYGNIIINNELLFYRFHYFHNLKNIPAIYTYSLHSFEMEKLENKTGYQYFIEQEYNKQRKYIINVLDDLNKLHQLKSINMSQCIIDRDIHIEFMDKVKHRLYNVSPLLKEFTYIKSINNTTIIDQPDVIIERMFNTINAFLRNNVKEYVSIHGDPHLSNIIYSDMKNYFIDPRGYFGNTKLFGPKEYDIAKVLYSLSGFDEINRNEQYIFYIDHTNITVSITNNMNTFLDLFDNKDVLISMVILHWFGLADYSKTNIHKCISAYYYGIYLYHIYCC